MQRRWLAGHTRRSIAQTLGCSDAGVYIHTRHLKREKKENTES